MRCVSAAVALLLFGAAGPHGITAQQLRGDAKRRLDSSGDSDFAECITAPHKIEKINYETVVPEKPNMFGWSVEPVGWTAFNSKCWKFSFPMCGGTRQSPVHLQHYYHRRLQGHGHDSHDDHADHDTHATGHDDHDDHDEHATGHDDHATGHDDHATGHDDHDTHATGHDDHDTHSTGHDDHDEHDTGHDDHGTTGHDDHDAHDSGHSDHSTGHDDHDDGHSMGSGGHESSGPTLPFRSSSLKTSNARLAVDDYFKSVRLQGFLGSLRIGGVTYEAQYLHLFAHGLHKVDGEFPAAEAFIVLSPTAHSSSAAWSPTPEGTTVIVSVLFKEGGESDLFDALGLDDAQLEAKPETTINLGSMLPKALSGTYFSYHGSLPVPPCWESVAYYVMADEQMVSAAQLRNLRAVIGVSGRDAYRPVQRNVAQTSAMEVDVDMKASCDELIEAHGDHVSQICWPTSGVESPVSLSSKNADMPEAKVPPHLVPKMSYRRLLASSERGEYSLRVLPAEGEHFGTLELDGRVYTAVSISVHALGQHIIDGERYDGEIHIQHELYGDWFRKEADGYTHHPVSEQPRRMSAAASNTSRRLDAFRGNTRDESDLNAAGGATNLLIVAIPLKLTTQPASELMQFLLPHSTGTFARDYASHDDLKAIFDSQEFYQYKGSAMHPPFSEDDETFHYIVYKKPLLVNEDQLYTESPTMSSFDSTAMPRSLGSRKVYGNHVPPEAMGTGKPCSDFSPSTWTYADEYCWSKIPGADGSPEYPACSGSKQSPINIDTSKLVPPGESPTGEAKPKFLSHVKYHPVSDLVVYHSGHAIEADDASNGDTHLGMGYITVMGEYYFIRQFHVHIPSEHVIDGKVYAGELQIVHQKQKKWNNNWGDDIIVSSVLFEIGDKSTLLEQLSLEYEEGSDTLKPKTMEYPFDMMRHIGPVLDGDWFRYDGSFTTPPCSENVKYFIFKTPMEMSTEQWLAFKGIKGYSNPANARSVQLLNDREVALNSYTAPGEPDTSPPDHEFWINRDLGRTRTLMFPRSPWLIMWVVVAIAVLATITMLFSFVREDSTRKAENAGGVTAAEMVRQRPYNRF